MGGMIRHREVVTRSREDHRHLTGGPPVDAVALPGDPTLEEGLLALEEEVQRPTSRWRALWDRIVVVEPERYLQATDQDGGHDSFDVALIAVPHAGGLVGMR
jgi:hypothetical protein